MNFYYVLSIALYILSLFLPTFNNTNDIYGFNCLLLGWLGIIFLSPFMALAWLANIFYFINLYRYRKNRKTIRFSILAIVLSLFAFGIEKIPMHSGGNTNVVFGLGFILWILSFLIFPLHNIEKQQNE